MTSLPPDFPFTGNGLLTPEGKPNPSYVSPGARKERLRRRQFETRRSKQPPSRYAELRVASSFSFLDGASQPEDLIARAADLGLGSVALIDRNGVYGAPRFYKAAREAGIRARVGAELSVGPRNPGPRTPPARKGASPPKLPRLSLFVENRQGYKNLCRLLTAAAKDRPKGDPRATWEMVREHAVGLHCLTGSDEGPLAYALKQGGLDTGRRQLERLAYLFEKRLHVELQRHGNPHEEHRNQALVDLANQLHLPLIATNGVRYAQASDKPLHDILTCIREHTTLDTAGRQLAAQRQRHLRSPAEMEALFSDLPQAIAASGDLSERLDFTLADLGYRFPDYPLPPGETPASYLRHITWNAAGVRFRPLTARAQRQIERELALIERLDLAGYFLIVWDIVRFCKRRGILAQGRGSAANSAVCYALSITAVDPVKMELLFERFLSEERGEWPDIDLDLPSGNPREEVIQYVYQRYGPHGAAMTANVITYRDRSAAREVAKALGYSPRQVDQLAKALGRWHYDESRGDLLSMMDQLTEAGFDGSNPRLKLFTEYWKKIQNQPRHLGQHSGGMVMAAGRLDEVVPLEPASMEGRVVVQWDKDDCADLGIIKVDLLGLGMLNALAEAVPLIRVKEGVDIDLAHLPPDDPKVYKMLQQADTIGVFQVESRAQMASLPRNHPTCFYDLVVQVAIIRPGPIVGGMVHPYFERRQKRQEVTYLHPSLEPVLKRTLGIPLFQEQILRMAMVTAGFSGGEAEELRRAMGFKRSMERMQGIEERLRAGMNARGITGEQQDKVVESITSFALYGFPESHAASFALIAYSSAYLRAHHPTAFLICLLNAWPMGFYHPATLVKDAQLHGVDVLPIDINASGWSCRWEEGACRLGLRFVHGLPHEAGLAIESEQAKRPFTSAADLARRARLREDQLTQLAHLGALSDLGLSRRQALWQVAAVSRDSGPLFEDQRSELSQPNTGTFPLPEMTPFEETLADFAGSGMTTGPHPVSYLRPKLDRWGVRPAATLPPLADGTVIRIGGSIITRQRPGTARGLLFVTLEDETGTIQAAVMPDLLAKHRNLIVRSPGLVIEGQLQKRDGSISVKAERLWPLALTPIPSHDFH